MKEFKTQKEIAEFIVENGGCFDVGCDGLSDKNKGIECPLRSGSFACDGFCDLHLTEKAKAYLASLEGNEAECECVTKTKTKREFTKNVTYELNGEVYNPEDVRANIEALILARTRINAQLKEKRATLRAFEYWDF